MPTTSVRGVNGEPLGSVVTTRVFAIRRSQPSEA